MNELLCHMVHSTEKNSIVDSKTIKITAFIKIP